MKTLRKSICALLALLLLVGMLPAAALADGDLWEGPVSAEMVSHFGANGLFDDVTYTDAAYYSDSWFLTDSATLNYELALMSAMSCGAAYSRPSDVNGRKIGALLEAMHFSDVERNEYYISGDSEKDSIGCIIGSKTINDESGNSCTLLAVFPRSASFDNEWAGDFDLGDAGDHASFALMRNQVLAFMGQYLTAHGITGSVKVWSAGYSRGAAAANMVGGYLAEHGEYFSGVTIAPEDLFVYTIATPLTVAVTGTDFSEHPYSGIHNFVAYGDLVTKLPPEDWGFTRYGQTVTIDCGEPAALDWLRLISAETAETFADGGYTEARPIKTLDFAALSLGDAGGKISPDALCDACVDALVGLVGQGGRGTFVAEDDDRILGDAATIFGMFGGIFAENITGKLESGELKTGELINAAIANYMVYAAEQQRKAVPGLTDEEAVTEVMIQLLAYVGINTSADETMKTLVEEGLAFLIKDLKTNQLHYNSLVGLVPEAAVPMFNQLWTYTVGLDTEPKTVNDLIATVTGSGVVNANNFAVIGDLIPQDFEYRTLYDDLTAYVVAQDVLPRTVDDAVSLLTRFIVANADAKPDGPVWKLLKELVPIIPTEPINMKEFIRAYGPMLINKQYPDETALEEIILDCIRACNDGVPGTYTAEQFRRTLSSLIFFGLGAGDIGSFVLDPENSDVTVGEFADNVLALALPKVELDKVQEQTKTLTLTEAADKALTDLLDAGMGAQGAGNPYAADLKANLSRLRTLATTIFFRPGDGYDLKSDVRNGTTVVDQIAFLFPAHYHELYISWLKTKVTCRVVFESNGGSAVEDVVGLAFGALVPKPEDPVRAGYVFGGWYQDEALTVPWRFDIDTVRGACTVLYAKWSAYNYVPASSGAAVTVPVSGESNTVSVSVTINGTTATISKPTDAQLESVIGEGVETGNVVIDLSGLERDIAAVSIPKETLTAISKAVSDPTNDASGLTVKLSDGAIRFDAAALAAIVAQAKGSLVTLTLDSIKASELNRAQQAAVKEQNVLMVWNVSAFSNGTQISDFRGGSAAISVPFTLGDGQLPNGLTVWYLAESGEKEEVPGAYNGKEESYTVTHLSNYALIYDEEKAAQCPKDASCPMSAFSDLAPTAWYHDGVHWALENGVMNGMGDGVFDPDGTTSRAMIVTILYRLEGEPMIRSGMPFDDVTESDWYAMAVSWAESQGIIDGYGDGRFGPNDPVTREQLAAILYRYAKLHGEGFTGLWSFQLDFPDAGDVADWATEAVSWMVMQGVINGMDGKLNPQGSATRAQAATMLRRFVIGA